MPAAISKKKDRTHLDPEIQECRNILRRQGWTQLEIARRFGVCKGHINFILNGRRKSRRIVNLIKELPENPNPA